jgi:20S proteasome alpha/beta subunit
MTRANDPRWFDQEYLNRLTKDQAIDLIENAVYDTCHLFERLEGVNKVYGNGHHMMQKVAEFAGNLMKERWKDPK